MISRIFLSLWVACAPKVEVAVAPPPPAPQVEQVQAAIAPNCHHNGLQAGPALRRAPKANQTPERAPPANDRPVKSGFPP